MISKAIKFGQHLSVLSAWAGGVILMLTAILITVEVILRKVFTVSMGGADEISGYAIAISCSFGFAYALFQKAHIRIDVLYNKCSQHVKFALDILAHGLLGLYLVVLSYYGFFVFWTSFVKHSKANTPLQTPLWIPQLIWIVGLWWFAIAIIMILVFNIYYYLKKDYITAANLCGTIALTQEIAQESVSPETKDDASLTGDTMKKPPPVS